MKEQEVVRFGLDGSERGTSLGPTGFDLHRPSVGSVAVDTFVTAASQSQSEELGSDCLAQIANQIPVESEVQIDVRKVSLELVSCGNEFLN